MEINLLFCALQFVYEIYSKLLKFHCNSLSIVRWKNYANN